MSKPSWWRKKHADAKAEFAEGKSATVVLLPAQMAWIDARVGKTGRSGVLRGLVATAMRVSP